MKKCKECDLEFENLKVYANHVRWNHKDNTNFKFKQSKRRYEEEIKKYGNFIDFITICSNCNKQITVKIREKNTQNNKKYYCSRSCANTRIYTEFTKNKISDAMKLKWQDEKYFTKHCNRDIKYFTSKGEVEIRNYFINNFTNDSWAFGGSLRFKNEILTRDLYSDKLKVCVEYDGAWHFINIKNALAKKQLKDKLLEEWCIANGYRLIRIKEEIYKSNRNKWLQILTTEIYKGTNQIIKFY